MPAYVLPMLVSESTRAVAAQQERIEDFEPRFPAETTAEPKEVAERD